MTKILSVMRIGISVFLIELAGVMLVLSYGLADADLKYSADLSGFSEVPQIFSQGTGIAKISGNDTILNYQINATGIENVTAVSINKGEETENGQVLVNLSASKIPTGPNQERMIQGIITNSSFQGPLAGKSIKDLVDLMNQNGTYVNINTTKFPQGELRGTIVDLGNSTDSAPSG
jgi:CHRD domain